MKTLKRLLRLKALVISVVLFHLCAFSPLFAQRTEIAPLLTSKWGQHEPYNEQCPHYYTNDGTPYLCNAGCVAVAMAQVMYYYRYPAEIQQDIKGYRNLISWAVHKNKKVWGIKIPYVEYVYADLKTIPAHTTIYWASMVDEYNGSESAGARYAVAALVLAAGESVVMKYDRSSSADPRTIDYALTNKFGYDATVRYVARKNYSDAAWEQLLYDELAAGRPVIYGGLKLNGSGHSFILDGYKDGQFHVNWGDDGYYNDYFPLNQLDPYYHWGGLNGYNYDQDAIIGIQPPRAATGINDLNGNLNDNANANTQHLTPNSVYDLQGRRVTERPLRKGIYIVNGKKTISK